MFRMLRMICEGDWFKLIMNIHVTEEARKAKGNGKEILFVFGEKEVSHALKGDLLSVLDKTIFRLFMTEELLVN